MSFESAVSDPGSTSSSFVAGVKSLDPEAWRKLSVRYGPLVYGWARRAGLGRDDATDITQDVFRSVVAGAGRLAHGRPGDSFRGWLRTITQNKIRDLWRTGGRQRAAGGSDANEQLLLVPEDSSNSEIDTPDRTGRLGTALESVRREFEVRTWQAFWRVTVDDRPPADVGRELEMSVNAVYVARSRILRRLREKLAE